MRTPPLPTTSNNQRTILWPKETQIGMDERMREQIEFWKMSYFFKTMPTPLNVRYPISLDRAVEWLGFHDTGAAKALFFNTFPRLISWDWVEENMAIITVDAFKRFMMIADTRRAVDCRTYFITAAEYAIRNTGAPGMPWLTLVQFMSSVTGNLPNFSIPCETPENKLWLPSECFPTVLLDFFDRSGRPVSYHLADPEPISPRITTRVIPPAAPAVPIAPTAPMASDYESDSEVKTEPHPPISYHTHSAARHDPFDSLTRKTTSVTPQLARRASVASTTPDSLTERAAATDTITATQLAIGEKFECIE